MTVAQSPRMSGPYTATAGQTVLDYDFPIDHASEIVVLRLRGTSEIALELGVDYGVTGVGGASGTIILTAGALEGDVFTLIGKLPIERVTNFTGFRSIPSNTINFELDRMTKSLQEMRRDVDGSIKPVQAGQAYDVGGRRIVNVGDPIDDNDAATKGWVNEAAESTLAAAEAARDAAIAAAATIPLSFETVADLLSTSLLSYVAGPDKIVVATGDEVDAQGYRYSVASSGSSDHHLETAGGVKLYALPSPGGIMDPMAWGPVADGLTNDQPILQKFHAYCASQGYAFLYPPSNFYLGSELQIKHDGDCSLANFFVNKATGAALLIGSRNNAPENVRRKTIFVGSVQNRAKVGTGWAGLEASIGVECANLYESRIYIRDVERFGIGVWAAAYNTGNVYNLYSFGLLLNNKVELLLQPGDSGGWVNENKFDCGRLAFDSNEGTTIAGACNIRLSNGPTTQGPPNNNRFWLSVEGNVPEFNVDCQGSFNIFDCRWESSIGPRVRLYGAAGAATVYNEFHGYAAYQIAFTIAGTNVSNNGMLTPRKTVLEGSGTVPPLQIRNTSGGSRTAPHARGWNATKAVLAAPASDTDWYYEVWGGGLAGKNYTDGYDRILLDWLNSKILVGTGASAAPTAGVQALGTVGLSMLGNWYFPTNGSSPVAVAGYAPIWFDGTNLKFRLPDGTIKTVTAT